MREFLKRFPAQEKFGWRANERNLRAVLDETGLSPAALQLRVRDWSRLRANLRPWDLAQEPPALKPVSLLPPDRPEARMETPTEEARDWIERVTSEWDGEDV